MLLLASLAFLGELVRECSGFLPKSPNFEESQLDGFLDFGISWGQSFPWEQRSIPQMLKKCLRGAFEVPKRYLRGSFEVPKRCLRGIL